MKSAAKGRAQSARRLLRLRAGPSHHPARGQRGDPDLVGGRDLAGLDRRPRRAARGQAPHPHESFPGPLLRPGDERLSLAGQRDVRPGRAQLAAGVEADGRAQGGAQRREAARVDAAAARARPGDDEAPVGRHRDPPAAGGDRGRVVDPQVAGQGLAASSRSAARRGRGREFRSAASRSPRRRPCCRRRPGRRRRGAGGTGRAR